MERINVYRHYSEDDYYQESQAAYSMGREFRPALEGWFDYDKAERFAENTEWNGSNHISVQTGSQWDHEALLRTKQGRWVLMTYSNRQGVMEKTYRFVSDGDAREWLIRNNDDAVVTRFFGEIEEERGPGRPAIGDRVEVRFDGPLLAMVDTYAEQRGIARAEAIRRLVTDAVTRSRVAEAAVPGSHVNR